MSVENEIIEIIDRETKAWDTQDVKLLLTLFHKDMVWVWPPDNKSFDPLSWVTPQGKFNEVRWSKLYSDLFESFELIHNKRETLKITTSNEGDGAFAVVDVDTLWRHKKSGEEMRWLGRTGKSYSLVNTSEWKMINQVGVFDQSLLKFF